ncbi:MAG: hypothetical protein KDB79_00850 [Acidobacteria bacterium]|nr:hypothetical protein [Acidobacteriota bacterium]
MNKIVFIAAAIIVFSGYTFAQKGIDKQTTTIKEQTNTSKTANDSGQTYSWGKDKTKIRKLLDNPFTLNSRRDVLIETIVDQLKNKNLIIDEAASRFDDGLIVTQPFTFSKGAILTKTELNRYAVIPDTDSTWTRGRYSLTIEVKSLDGIKNNVYVTAKVEGRSGNGLFTEWSTLQSTGIAEDEFLSELAQSVTGDVSEGERRP